MVRVVPKSKQECVCNFLPSSGTCLPLKIQKNITFVPIDTKSSIFGKLLLTV